jgi:hypothetical protein
VVKHFSILKEWGVSQSSLVDFQAMDKLVYGKGINCDDLNMKVKTDHCSSLKIVVPLQSIIQEESKSEDRSLPSIRGA